MQLDILTARKAVNVARLSGISVKRFEDRSSECKELASGTRLEELMEVSELSARLKCLKNRHFDALLKFFRSVLLFLDGY